MRKATCIAATLLALLLAAAGLFYAYIRHSMPDANVPLEVVASAPDVYWIKGGISNMGFVVGKTGVIAIDAQFYEKTAANALAAIRRVTPKPVRHVILTHSDPDHVNGLPSFPAGVEVIAHPRTKVDMLAALDGWKINPSAPPPALRRYLPSRLVTSSADLEIDGVRLEIMHVSPAHTDGDLVMFLPAQKVVFAGDILTPEIGAYPGIHLDKHGSTLGWIKTVEAMLQLNADVFLSGHGKPLNRSEVEARLAAATLRRAEIAALVAKGRSLKEIREALRDKPLPGVASRFPTFVETTYAELIERGPAN